VEAANRKLIRPSLSPKERPEGKRPLSAPPLLAQSTPPLPQKKPVPPEATNAENFYYAKQIQLKTPMVLVLRDGEKVSGVIEWYDRCCIKLTSEGGENLMVYKPAIKYMYKSEG
jgi:sRNA-binding regulator protein Hfq